MTAKQLEQETGCKIMVRGKGSMRDKKKVSARLTHIFESVAIFSGIFVCFSFLLLSIRILFICKQT